MNISIFGKNIEIPEWFKDKILKELNDITHKYFNDLIDGSVTFNKIATSTYLCQIHVHASRSLSLRGQGKSDNVQQSFTIALEHLGNRLHRYKNRLLSQRNHAVATHDLFEGSQYVIDNHPVARKENTEQITDKPDNVLTHKPTHIDTLSIRDAIMILDLSERSVLMFKNLENNRINVVYKQDNNTIVWLDSGNSP